MSGTSAERTGQDGRIARVVEVLSGAMAGWPFAAVSLSALAAGGAATVAMLAWPAGDGELAAFAQEFRRWCFGREKSGIDLGLLVLAVSSPLVLAGLVLGGWRRPLRDALVRAPARVLALSGATAMTVLLAGVMLFATQERPVAADADGRLPFPGRSIRTSVPAGDLELADHRGGTTSLRALRGRVVIVTAVYSRCSTACPMILAESRALMDSLDPAERESVTLLGVTLDPAHDTRERLAEIANGHGIPGDARLLTGDAVEVGRILDRFGFERRVDPATGRIDHASLFVLIDRAGFIAYRLAASSSQDQWLGDAVRELAREPAPPAPPLG